MGDLADILRRGANGAWGLGLTEGQLAQFARYAELLVEWNAARLNLTRLTSPRDIAVKHFLDSLAVLKAVDVPHGASVIDVGTGAGLPGLALKIARPDLRMTLLDATAKKLVFCRAVADGLGLGAVTTIHARAEDAGRQPAHAGAYDFALARAVAPLERLLPWCVPFVRPGGLVVALKGASVAEELPAARPVARRLGLTLSPPLRVELPEAEEPLTRFLITVRRPRR
ncbi:MAG: 16S rRNA (guanine(527)-N(7))-methyltransferase RsmG [Armatimonadetes bacterium]|nr:16S rRNA (guanine(527)-N(7))-methyltransferase RsmG [Armatimonadota bacterium]